jgi:hypothetical protein
MDNPNPYLYDCDLTNNQVNDCDGLTAIQRRLLVADYLKLKGLEFVIGRNIYQNQQPDRMVDDDPDDCPERLNLMLKTKEGWTSFIFAPRALTCLVETLGPVSDTQCRYLGLDPRDMPHALHWHSLSDLFRFLHIITREDL